MDRRELDTFLRTHTLFEDVVLRLRETSDRAELEAFVAAIPTDPRVEKKFPIFQKDEVVDVLLQSKPLLEEPMIRSEDTRFAIACHPRFVPFIEHSHNYLELVFVYSGQCRQRVNGNEVVLNAGDACIFDTNVNHSIDPIGENDIVINLMLGRAYLDHILLNRLAGNDLLSAFFVHALYQSHRYNDYILFSASKSQRVFDLMVLLVGEYFDEAPCYLEAMNSYLVLVFTELLRLDLSGTKAPVFSAVSDDKILNILAQIEQNCLNATLQSVAEQFAIHPNYLSIIVRKVTGRNFIRFVQDAKLKRAAALFENSNLPAAEVARECGYENVSFFYRLFRSRYGCTPAQYRAAH